MESSLQEKFGPQLFLEKYVYPSLYFNAAFASFSRARRLEVLEVAGKAALSVEGVAGYFAPGMEAVPAGLGAAYARSTHQDRSGDLLLSYKPYFVEDFAEGQGTSSGSAYPYDTHVPLIFFGKGFRAGRFREPVDAASIAPTISAVLEIAAPAAARFPVLHQAFQVNEEKGAEAGPPAPK